MRYRYLRRIFAFLLLLLFVVFSSTSLVYSQEEDTGSGSGYEEEQDDSLEGFGEDDLDSGFGEETGFTDVKVDRSSIESGVYEKQLLTFTGFFEEEIDYSHAHEDPDFSKIRSVLNLNLDFRFSDEWRAAANWNGFYDYSYTYRGRDEFTEETLETYETESEIRDFHIDGGLTDWMRLKIGRQIIAWGVSESSQLLDMANPRDMRELGMVDLEDSRLHVAATKFSFLFGGYELNAVAIHEMRGNKLPAKGSEFDLFTDLRGSSFMTIEEEEVPENSAENTEYLLRLFKPFNGGDFSIVWADVYDDAIYADFESLSIQYTFYMPPIPPEVVPLLTLQPRHKRIKTYGFAGNLVSGSWLFKGEIAQKEGKALLRNDIDAQMQKVLQDSALLGKTLVTYDEESEIIQTWSEKDITQGMIGLEYSGITNLTVTLEAAIEKINDYEDNLDAKETTGQLAMIVSHSAMNQLLDTQFFWIHFTDNNGDVYRFNIGYDVIDALNVSGGMIFYEASDEEGTVYPYRNNDRVFAALKYSFQ